MINLYSTAFNRSCNISSVSPSMSRKSESVTQSQLAILRAAACTIEEKPIPRPAEQHVLVKQGVENIVEEQVQSGGGQLGGPSGARRRTYERLKQYAESMQGTLFPPSPELLAAIGEIYRYPLRESAKDTLNRQLRSGIDNEQLTQLVVDLRADDRLCIVQCLILFMELSFVLKELLGRSCSITSCLYCHRYSGSLITGCMV